MNDKILTIITLAIIFVFAGNTYAANQKNNGEMNNQVQQQNQTINQGADIQIQNNTQVQNNNSVNQVNPNSGTQNQIQTQKKLQDGSEEGNQVQNQNQVNNQAKPIQEQSVVQKSTNGSEASQQRINKVSNAVQEMLQVADRNEGVGQQVKIIAQEQNQNQEKIEKSLEKVQNRNIIAKFLIGPNYGEINNIEKKLEQNTKQIKQLNEIKNQLINEGDQQKLTQQIQVFEQAKLEIENALKSSQGGVSLFGWMFRLFSR
jgi:vacuolar-type H+-ATPase subunit I/STV1